MTVTFDEQIYGVHAGRTDHALRRPRRSARRGQGLELRPHRIGTGPERAALARRLVHEGLDRREALALRRKLAADYAAGRADSKDLLRDFEPGQLDLLDE